MNPPLGSQQSRGGYISAKQSTMEVTRTLVFQVRRHAARRFPSDGPAVPEMTRAAWGFQSGIDAPGLSTILSDHPRPVTRAADLQVSQAAPILDCVTVSRL